MSVVWTALRRSSSTMMEDMIRRSSSTSTSMMMVSRSMSSHNNNNNNNNRNNNYRNRNSGKVRSNNPPSPNRKNNRSMTKLRNHAVSIFQGNYEDYYNSEEEEEEAFPREGGYDYEGDGDGVVEKSVEDQQREERLAERVYQEQVAKEAQQRKWLENSKMPLRTVQVDDRGRAYGKGGRKTSSARVWIQPGDGMVTVNRRTLLDYFPRESHRELLLSPLIATQTVGQFDIVATVEGGGLSGKAGAIRHGLARALQHYNPIDHRPPLKKLGYLTRDPRKVERKKIGLKKARKAPQWVRR